MFTQRLAGLKEKARRARVIAGLYLTVDQFFRYYINRSDWDVDIKPKRFWLVELIVKYALNDFLAVEKPNRAT